MICKCKSRNNDCHLSGNAIYGQQIPVMMGSCRNRSKRTSHYIGKNPQYWILVLCSDPTSSCPAPGANGFQAQLWDIYSIGHYCRWSLHPFLLFWSPGNLLRGWVHSHSIFAWCSLHSFLISTCNCCVRSSNTMGWNIINKLIIANFASSSQVMLYLPTHTAWRLQRFGWGQ